MRAAVATQPGSPDTANEDWAGVLAPGLAVVLDGLSAPDGTGTGCRHGTPWYVSQLGPRLLALAADPSRSLADALAEAIRRAASLHPGCDLKHPGTPSATMVLLRAHDEGADYLALADAVLLGIGCLHGTAWFVTQLGVQSVSAATIARDEPLQDLVAGAISRVADSHAHTCDLEHPGTPSSSLAILREHAQHVEYLLLFDSVIALDGPSGLSVISDRRVDAFAREEDLATRGYPGRSPAMLRTPPSALGRALQRC
jgi:sulfur transfer complex TusBCD TusB component (DsrH family)